ncbi:MAG: hypothetical protein MHMPM18_003249, partial [Marteilia pararefringens]
AFFYSEIISFVFDQLNTLILISIYDISDESSRSKFYALNAATLPGGAFLGLSVCSLAYDDSLQMAQRDYSKLGTILFTSTMAITVYYYQFMPETLNSQYDDEDLRNEMMKNLNPFQFFKKEICSMQYVKIMLVYLTLQFPLSHLEIVYTLFLKSYLGYSTRRVTYILIPFALGFFALLVFITPRLIKRCGHVSVIFVAAFFEIAFMSFASVFKRF